MSKTTFAVAAGLLAVASAFAAPPDYVSLPEEPSQVHQNLSGCQVGLLQAVVVAQTETKGIAQSAQVIESGDTKTVEVEVYTPTDARKLSINPNTAAIESNTVDPRNPG